AGGINWVAVRLGLETADTVIAMARSLWLNSRTEDIMKTERIPYLSSLAVSFNNLTLEEVKAMGEDLEVAIAGTSRILKTAQHDGTKKTFDDYVKLMSQNTLLKTDSTEDVVRSRFKRFKEFSFVKNDINNDIVKEVVDWFNNEVVVDRDVMTASRIEIVDFANIVAATGAAFEGVKDILGKKKYVERGVVDLGFIRYPDTKHPYFKIFRIRLFAYRKHTRVTVVQRDESGIRAQFESKIYRPNDAVLKRMSKGVKDFAKAEAEAMFSV
ncbi:uncharacterized protein LOC115213512, partial [Argonauta hians]